VIHNLAPLAQDGLGERPGMLLRRALRSDIQLFIEERMVNSTMFSSVESIWNDGFTSNSLLGARGM